MRSFIAAAALAAVLASATGAAGRSTRGETNFTG